MNPAYARRRKAAESKATISYDQDSEFCRAEEQSRESNGAVIAWLRDCWAQEVRLHHREISDHHRRTVDSKSLWLSGVPRSVARPVSITNFNHETEHTQLGKGSHENS
jgi:hypothetical protein